MSAGYVSKLLLLSEGVALTASKNGTPQALIVEQSLSQFQADFEAVFQLTWTPTGVTSPTFDAQLQVSYDNGTTWIPDASMTQRTTAGTTIQRVTAKPGTMLRVVVVLGGSGGSHSWLGQVWLTSTQSIKGA